TVIRKCEKLVFMWRVTGLRWRIQETKEQPTRVPPAAVCCLQTGFRFTRTGGRIGTCRTANRFSGTSSCASNSMATPPKPRSRTRGQDLRSGRNRVNGGRHLTMVFFIRRTFGLNRNRRREWSRRLGGNRGSCGRFDGRPRFDAVGSVDCFFVVVVLLAVKALVSNVNKLIRLLGIFREDSNAMVHA